MTRFHKPKTGAQMRLIHLFVRYFAGHMTEPVTQPLHRCGSRFWCRRVRVAKVIDCTVDVYRFVTVQSH